MKTLSFIVSIGLLFLIAACTPVPPSLSDIIGRIRYVKDANAELCFATIVSKTDNSSGFFVTSITEVPCEKVEKLLVR